MDKIRLKKLKTFFLFCIINLNYLYSQDNIIIEDNWDQTTDKLAHSTTSFGLYYTLRYFEFSKFEAFTAATIIGFSYEVYQINDPRETDSDFRGISVQDMGYNVLGILSAYAFDKAITLTKSNLSKYQAQNKNRNRAKYALNKLKLL